MKQFQIRPHGEYDKYSYISETTLPRSWSRCRQKCIRGLSISANRAAMAEISAELEIETHVWTAIQGQQFTRLHI